jgi:serine/threonine protein kinase
MWTASRHAKQLCAAAAAFATAAPPILSCLSNTAAPTAAPSDMAPEVFLGTPYNEAADVFSLGECVKNECL